MTLRNFQYSLPTQLIFGENCLSYLQTKIEENSGTKVAVVMGQGSAREHGVFDEISSALQLPAEILDGCPQSPSVEFITDSVHRLKNSGVDFILAVGGGSVIDASKAIALALANNTDDIWQYKSKAVKPLVPALPIGVVLTTTGTGSEVNGGFVIQNENTSENFAFSDLTTRPRFACCDPSVTYSLPLNVLEDNYTDILSHLLEQYFSEDEIGYIDQLLVASIAYLLTERDGFTSLKKNYFDRSNLMLASSFAMSYLFSMGKHVNWVLHHCAHELSIRENISHGSSLRRFLPRWLCYLAQNERYDQRFQLLANRMCLKGEELLEQKKQLINLIIHQSEHSEIDSHVLSKVSTGISANQSFCERARLTPSDLECLFSSRKL